MAGPHTVRGSISGALKKKLGLPITAEKVEGRGTVYRIAFRPVAISHRRTATSQ
jgi:hypothetical protein